MEDIYRFGDKCRYVGNKVSLPTRKGVTPVVPGVAVIAIKGAGIHGTERVTMKPLSPVGDNYCGHRVTRNSIRI